MVQKFNLFYGNTSNCQLRGTLKDKSVRGGGGNKEYSNTSLKSNGCSYKYISLCDKIKQLREKKEIIVRSIKEPLKVTNYLKENV